MHIAKTLIRLGGCPGWSESLLTAHAILLVFSCVGSNNCDRAVFLYQPQHEEKHIRTCESSEDSDQPAHSRSRTRIFAWQILDNEGCKVSLYGQEDSDQSARMRRLIWVFVRRACQKVLFFSSYAPNTGMAVIFVKVPLPFWTDLAIKMAKRSQQDHNLGKRGRLPIHGTLCLASVQTVFVAGEYFLDRLLLYMGMEVIYFSISWSFEPYF